MKRRAFIAGLGSAAVWPVVARAQQTRKTPRIAVLTLESAKTRGLMVDAFIDGLRRLGYVPGQSVEIDYRYAESDNQQLKSLAQELIALKPDVSLGANPSAVRALKIVAPTLPIVCPTLTDALIPDLAASYARPGGSVTGIANNVEGMMGKLIELATEIVPGIRRIGFLFNPAGASMPLFARRFGESARAIGITVVTEEALTADDLSPALDRLAKQQIQAVVVPLNSLFLNQSARIVANALAAHVPVIFSEREDVEAGGLASYGIDQRENYRRAASYVDKILKGALPGDLPIEFPTKVQLTINIKTAKALGLEIPPQLLARADEVIE
jgi:putative tryptophan/tyrosine transport system substrate-binding protein